jgi:hypothetical protein
VTDRVIRSLAALGGQRGQMVCHHDTGTSTTVEGADPMAHLEPLPTQVAARALGAVGWEPGKHP